MATPGVLSSTGVVGDGIDAGPDGPLTNLSEDDKALYWASQGVAITGGGTSFQSQIAPFISKSGELQAGYHDAVASVLQDNAARLGQINATVAAFDTDKATAAAQAQATRDAASLLDAWRQYIADVRVSSPGPAALLDPDSVPSWFASRSGDVPLSVARLTPPVLDPGSVNARDAALTPVSAGAVTTITSAAANAATVETIPAAAGTAVTSGDDTVVQPEGPSSGLSRAALFVGAAGIGVLLLRAISSNKR